MASVWYWELPWLLSVARCRDLFPTLHPNPLAPFPRWTICDCWPSSPSRVGLLPHRPQTVYRVFCERTLSPIRRHSSSSGEVY
uniref:Putative secreted protein n=1 Tax=Anopheles marajoara TaxID=58244 RepID=A0A2M4CB59_9DIPT